MPKSPFFKFKQFTVWHDRCGLKVTTEACLIGALADVQNATRILDIGTGSGLLALMAAQRNPLANIDAVEIDETAFEQATQNCKESFFLNRISVIHAPIQQYAEVVTGIYDSIISNPPFFENHLPSSKPQKHKALHNDLLSYADLAMTASKLLREQGKITVIYPPNATEKFIVEANKAGLYLQSQVVIKQFKDKDVFRLISVFCKNKKEVNSTPKSLIIYDIPNSYSKDFIELLKDFYLFL